MHWNLSNWIPISQTELRSFSPCSHSVTGNVRLVYVNSLYVYILEKIVGLPNFYFFTAEDIELYTCSLNLALISIICHIVTRQVSPYFPCYFHLYLWHYSSPWYAKLEFNVFFVGKIIRYCRQKTEEKKCPCVLQWT